MAKLGHSSWVFPNNPTIISTGVVGGPFEAKSNLTEAFDFFHEDLWLREDSFEKAQQKLMEDAAQIALKKGNINKEQINVFLSGDLINQITPTTFAAKTIGVPYLGLFSACATATEGLALAALIINSNSANYVLSGTASHHSATERQYRYPTEYGGQKPPTAQWTVTGAGCALIGKEGTGPKITTATIGNVIDMGVTDPLNMGGAMAPAAVDTIIRHLTDRQVASSFYDIIITGDLGKIGHESSYALLKEKGIKLDKERYVDCGKILYQKNQPVHAGGSGTACSAVVTFGHFLKKLEKGTIERLLFVATGSLHSPLTIQQGQSIPCIAHAVSIERKETV